MNAHALLDHPWPLDDVLDETSEGFDVLRRFVDLQRRQQLELVPFLDAGELAEFWQRVSEGANRRNPRAFASILSFSNHLVRNFPVGCEATPQPEPLGLTAAWKASLRDSMEQLENWRQPQIIVAEVRRPHWPATWVQVIFEECAQQHQGKHAAGERIVAFIGSYDAHPFAVSDFDPWSLDRTHPPGGGGPQHPCRLPKPPLLQQCSFDDLQQAIPAARASGWLIGGRYYYIPPEDWSIARVTQQRWREGRAFPRRRVETSERPGYVDYADRVWVWDLNERHWDVQLGGTDHKRVRHSGQEESPAHFCA